VCCCAVYPVRRRLYEARSTPEKPPGGGILTTVRSLLRPRRTPAFDEPLSEILSVQVDGQAIDLHCTNGALRLEVLAADLIRARAGPSGQASFAPLTSYALDPETQWPAVPFDVEDSVEAVTIRCARLTCHVSKRPCRVDFSDAKGHPLSLDAEGLGFRGRGAFCTRGLAEGEAIYGLGEKAFGLNLRGRALELWNRDPECYSPGDGPLYLSIPLVVGLCDGQAYGLFFDNPGRARIDLPALPTPRPQGARDPGSDRQDRQVKAGNPGDQAQISRLRYEVDTGELCFYFFAGPTLPAVLERYTQLTGRMPLPPRWLLGYQQSRWSYFPEGQVRELAAELRRRRIP